MDLIFQLYPNLGFLANLCDLLSSLTYSLLFPVGEGVPRFVSVPKGKILVSS